MGVSRQIQDLTHVKAIIWDGVADIASLKAIVGTDRADKQLRFVKDQQSIFYFDSLSTATPDDVLIIKPNDVAPGDPGRWFKIESKSIEVYDKIGVMSDGQTAFVLSKLPAIPDTVAMIPVGGIELVNGVDYTVSGKNVTYVGTISFVTGEIIIFKYESFEM